MGPSIQTSEIVVKRIMVASEQDSFANLTASTTHRFAPRGSTASGRHAYCSTRRCVPDLSLGGAVWGPRVRFPRSFSH